jgi:hypothetical protein
MTARSTMADLITKTRLLIGDPLIAGTPPTSTFSDNEIQDALDSRRVEVTECQLAFRPFTAPGGTVTFHDYYAPRGYWEDTVVLKDRTYAVITPDTADLLTGHWTWVANEIPPIYITGLTYDTHGAAYDLLQAWAGKVAREFDFGTDQQTFNRSQKREGLIALANEYARRTLPRGMRAAWHADIGEW